MGSSRSERAGLAIPADWASDSRIHRDRSTLPKGGGPLASMLQRHLGEVAQAFACAVRPVRRRAKTDLLFVCTFFTRTYLPTSEAAWSRCESPKPGRQPTVKNCKQSARRARSHHTAGDQGQRGWRLPVNTGRTVPVKDKNIKLLAKKTCGREGQERKPPGSVGRYGGGV